MKLAFMSSVCPRLSLPELLATGKSHGYQAVEFRPEWGHEHGVELEASDKQLKDAKQMIADSALEACCLSPGTRFCHAETEACDADYEKLLRYIELAARMSIPTIRVFGDLLPHDGTRARNYRVQADYLGRAAEHAEKAEVMLAIETHRNFRGFDAGEVLFQAGYPAALGVNWHLSHCIRHGEDVDEAYRHIKGRIVHAHFSLGKEQADIPFLNRQLTLLRDEGYDAYYSLELIGPENPEQSMRDHAAWWEQAKSTVGV